MVILRKFRKFDHFFWKRTHFRNSKTRFFQLFSIKLEVFLDNSLKLQICYGISFFWGKFVSKTCIFDHIFDHFRVFWELNRRSTRWLGFFVVILRKFRKFEHFFWKRAHFRNSKTRFSQLISIKLEVFLDNSLKSQIC